MLDQMTHETLLKRIDALGREIEHLKRDLLHSLVMEPQVRKTKSSLFGSVRGGEVTEEMIKESKQALFRPLEDL